MEEIVVVGGGAAGVAAAETLRQDGYAGCEAVIEEGSPGDGKFVALYRKDGVPTAVLGWNAPARVPAYRKLLLG